MSASISTSLRHPPSPHADAGDARVQLVTRIPLRLHRAVKLRSIATDTTLTAFIVGALREKLDRERSPGAGAEE